MSKSVLISIHPEWCEKIASGQKTIEVRKTRPKIETPFKCYIYCTKSGKILSRGVEILNGCVIGEFVCDRLVKAECGHYCRLLSTLYTDILPQELFNYANYKPLYGWHISELVIYDKLRKLSEFRKPGYRTGYKIVNDNKRGVVSVPFTCENAPLQRPPRSWCYVQERCFI